MRSVSPSSRSRWIRLGAVLLLAGCSGGFRYERLSLEDAPATQEVAWLTAAPGRPYTVIAKFRGSETALCAPSRPRCSLYDEAMKQGADAIWLQRRDTWTRPEEWVMIRGRMERIRSQEYETLEGVLIRYTGQ